MQYEQLKLENQICFPLYAASRLITRGYQPHLEKLGITYPQYLVLMVLWEEDGITVNDIAAKLILNTNTVTPLLKRMEVMGIISRRRSMADERKVLITLTEKGRKMRDEAAAIPLQLVEELQQVGITAEELMELKQRLDRLMEHLKEGSDLFF
ncbi:MAG: transcriptional regulator, marr family protein [Proteiniphilum sp. 51_7]|nr:MAG: transcriptional regulator, marr family protein [Proteiniphilum sp. 51_7]